MSNTNLATSSSRENAVSAMSWGNVILFLILLLVLATYGGLLFWKNSLEKSITDTKNAHSADVASFSSDNAKNVVDFQNRLTIAKNLLNDNSNNINYLSALEKNIVPGAHISSYKFDKTANTINLNCVADNYNIVAKQILSFKTSGQYASVFGGQTSFDSTTNKIDFSVILNIK